MSKKMLTVTAVATQTQSASPKAAPQPTTSKQCYSEPCYGNASRETIYERIGDGKSDLIRAFGNYDRLHANLDGAIGGTGYDWCHVDAEIEAADTCERVVVR
jgi:hypothetical protein